MIKPGTLTHQVGHVIDFMPTCIELAETEYPEKHNGHKIIPVEGKSLVPIFRGKTRRGHDTLYWEWAGNRAVRQGKWKLTWDKQFRQWELYDLTADRTETDDLSGQYPERVNQIREKWEAWAEQTGLKTQPKRNKPKPS